MHYNEILKAEINMCRLKTTQSLRQIIARFQDSSAWVRKSHFKTVKLI